MASAIPTTITLDSNERVLSNDFGELLRNGTFADIKIRCPLDKSANVIDRSSIDAHRQILAARSPVFLAMLNKMDGSTTASSVEAKSGEVNVDDVDDGVMRSLLQFLYAGRCSIPDSLKALQDLFIAADAYELEDLKKACEEELSKRITVASAIDVVLLAHRHSAATLRQDALECIEKNGKAIGEQAETVDKLESYPQLLKDVVRAATASSTIQASLAKKLRTTGPVLPKCYMDVEIEQVPAGRIIVELRSDVVPKTSEKFLVRCLGTNGVSYKGSMLERHSGHIRSFTGNLDVKEKFEQENYTLKHDAAGTLSMLRSTLNSGRKMSTNNFFISTKARPELDGSTVAVGKVIAGMEIVQKIESGASVKISGCGQI